LLTDERPYPSHGAEGPAAEFKHTMIQHIEGPDDDEEEYYISNSILAIHILTKTLDETHMKQHTLNVRLRMTRT
jgi:hypothetical protein